MIQSKQISTSDDKGKTIAVQAVDGISEMHMRALAMLEKFFFIERIMNNSGTTEFWLLETLPKTINALREMKNANLIEEPDNERSIEGFIKKYLRSKIGKPLDNNLRQLRHLRKLKMRQQSA